MENKNCTRVKITFILVIVLFIQVLSFAQQPAQLLRTPSISPKGDQIAFSHQGDIWIVQARGGQARRITIHEAYETNPHWISSTALAYESNRYGHSDIFISDPVGSAPTRLTFHSNGNSYPRSAKGQIYFSTNRIDNSLEWSKEVYAISQKGGTPFKAMNATGYHPNPSSNNRYIAYERGPCRTARVRYKGSANKDIWVYDKKKGEHHQITSFEGQDIMPDWVGTNKLYYLSAQNGWYNLYLQKIETGRSVGQPQVLTTFKEEGIRSFDISEDGRWAIIERDLDLYLLSLDGENHLNKLEIFTNEDYHFYPSTTKKYTGGVTDFDLSPNEKYVAMTIHGEIFIKPLGKDLSKAQNISKHAFRDQQSKWLNDSTVIMVSDRDGQNDLYQILSTDTSEPSLYKSFMLNYLKILEESTDQNKFILSHKRDKVAILSGRGKLTVMSIDSTGQLSNAVVLLDGWATPNGIVWSPDDQWLAYSINDLDFNSEIIIHSVDSPNKKINVSMHPRPDRHPVWSPDGSKLGFLSKRNNDDWDVWFVWLKEEDYQKTKEDWDNVKYDDESKKKAENDTLSNQSIVIDTENIYNRLHQVTALVGNEDNLLISEDGEQFYFTTISGLADGSKQKYGFYQIQWDGSKPKKLIDDQPMNHLRWNKKRDHIYYIGKGGKLNKLNISSGKSEGEPIEARLVIDHLKERQQVFNEAWRSLKDGFYDPNFHGQDWESLRSKYYPKVMMAQNKQDFRMLFNEMLGQLNASHMGIYGSNEETIQKRITGQLGVMLESVKGGVKVTKVLDKSPAARTASLLKNGDIIQSVNGQNITPRTNIYELLEGQVGQRIWLVIDRAGRQENIYIRPVKSLKKELYESWVNWQKRLTDKYSGGTIGYIHIQGMNWSSFERFQRELTASGQGKDGIVIDVRYNGGGWTTDMLMAILNVKQHAYTIPRGAAKSLNENNSFKNHYPYGERLPFPPLLKPTVALCNESSYSNAEIFSHAYKHLKLGQLVGTPTFGAVISTGGQSLLDGSFVRMPFRAWYALGTGKNMEWTPAIPDEIIFNAPDFINKNEDVQLKRAIEILKN